MPGIKFCALLTSILGPGSFALMKEKLMLHVFEMQNHIKKYLKRPPFLWTWLWLIWLERGGERWLWWLEGGRGGGGTVGR